VANSIQHFMFHIVNTRDIDNNFNKKLNILKFDQIHTKVLKTYHILSSFCSKMIVLFFLSFIQQILGKNMYHIDRQFVKEGALSARYPRANSGMNCLPDRSLDEWVVCLGFRLVFHLQCNRYPRANSGMNCLRYPRAKNEEWVVCLGFRFFHLQCNRYPNSGMNRYPRANSGMKNGWCVLYLDVIS
ncbi:hypothetical protein ACJX0J_033572, partial [Zea mays]